MAFRIAPSQPVTKARPIKKPEYLDFIRQLPCVVCGAIPVDAAHLSMAQPKVGHYGRGKAQKASDRWTLPLCRTHHDEQHKIGEDAFWKGRNPHLLCLVLWGLWNERKAESVGLAEKLLRVTTP